MTGDIKDMSYVKLLYTLYLCTNQLLERQLTCGLIVVDTDPVQLQVTISVVSPCGINAVLIADHFPELQKQNGGYHMTVTCKESTYLSISNAVFGIGDLKRGKQQWVCIFGS